MDSTTEITPSEIPDPVLEPGWEGDAASDFELENWGNLDKLSRQKRQNELAFHRAVGCCIPLAIGIAFLGLTTSAIIYLIHVLAPDSWRWLNAEEVDRIHNMLFSGAVGAGLAEAVRYYMRKERR